jgi:hypothetical protein
MGSVAMTYVSDLIKIGSGVQKLMRGYTYTVKATFYFYFLQNNESRLEAYDYITKLFR